MRPTLRILGGRRLSPQFDRFPIPSFQRAGALTIRGRYSAHRGCRRRDGPHDWRVARNLEHDARRSRGTTQGIRGRVTVVLHNQLIAALKSHASERSIRSAVHGLWRERAREQAPYEDEVLILARPAHPVVSHRPTDHDCLPASLIRADEIPAQIPQTLVFVQLGWAGQVFAPRIDGCRNLRCSGYGQPWFVPGGRLLLVEPGGALLLSAASSRKA